MAVCWF